jgi:peptide/nickel transport system permease protein
MTTDFKTEEVTAQSTAEAGAAVEITPAASSWREVWRRFAENKLAVLGLIMIFVLFVTAAFAPLLAPYDPYDQDLANTLAPPSSEHWLGTDPLGRDQLSRLIYGSRIAVIVGLASIIIATIIGVTLGALSGWYGGRTDAVIMRIADVFFAFPLLIGAILIILVLGRGILPVVLSLAIFSWATVARLQRSSILSVRESDYVMAARALGAGGWRLVSRHVLPNSFAPVLVFATFSVGVAVVAEASLSFLGVGVKADVPEWGNMISVGRSFVGSNDYLWLFPSLAVVLTVLGFVFAGDGLRDALDPRLT